jgi:hypothetical protein
MLSSLSGAQTGRKYRQHISSSTGSSTQQLAMLHQHVMQAMPQLGSAAQKQQQQLWQQQHQCVSPVVLLPTPQPLEGWAGRDDAWSQPLQAAMPLQAMLEQHPTTLLLLLVPLML